MRFEIPKPHVVSRLLLAASMTYAIQIIIIDWILCFQKHLTVDPKISEMVVFNKLCMEPGQDGIMLVVYQQNVNATVNITISESENVPCGKTKWSIQFSTLLMPVKDGYTYSKATFFVSSTCSGNFHHFWVDTVNGLYGAMKETQMLGSLYQSQLYYASDVRNFGPSDCHDPSRYEDILFALSINSHIYYKNAKPNTCFETAVFGNNHKTYSTKEKYDYFRRAFHVMCQTSNKVRVTIINQKVRRILNVDELQKAAENVGFITKIVDLSDLSLLEQFKVMMCTDILVGIRGAGLRWMDFLPPERSAVLELIWRHWPSRFAFEAHEQGKKAATLEADKVILNLPEYFNRIHKPCPNMTVELLQEYYNKAPEHNTMNHWEYASGYFDPQVFLKSLIYLLRYN